MPSTASAVNLPFKEAIDYFRQKTDIPTKHWTAVMDEAHARSFMVAGAASKALVKDFRGAVDKAISQGTGLQDFRKTFDTLVEKHGWSHTGSANWRAKVIYQTNMSNAFAAGRYAQMTDPDVLAAFPYWQYQHVNCPHPRMQHLAWSGMVLRADDPFWATCYPPNGWGCHCIVLAVSERRLASMGKTAPDKSPDLKWMEYINKTTGVVTKYPAGVDPGFAYNPGKAWKDGAKQPVKAPDVKPMGPVPPVMAQPGASAVPQEVLRKFLAAPQGSVQVGALDAKTMKALGAESPAVLLSDDTMKKQLGLRADKDGHPEVFVKDYAALDGLIAQPAAVYKEGDKAVRLVGRVGDQVGTVVVKRTAQGHETYVKTFFLVGERFLKKLAKRQALAGEVQALLEYLRKRVQ